MSARTERALLWFAPAGMTATNLLLVAALIYLLGLPSHSRSGARFFGVCRAVD